MLRVRNLRPSDLENCSGVVYGDSTQVSGGVQSEDMFGKEEVHDRTRIYDRRETEHKRGYIPLVKPCINFVKTRAGASLLAKILGLKKQIGEDIVEFKVGWSVEEEDLIEINPISNDTASKIKLGAEVFLELIDRMNIINRIAFTIEDSVCGLPGKVTKSVTKYPLIGDYYFQPENSDVEEMLGDDAYYFARKIADYLETGEETLCYLVNLDSLQTLRDLFINDLIVIPLAMRPKIDKRTDPLTKKYSRVVIANESMRQVLENDCTIAEYREAYKSLQISVTNVVYKNTLRRSRKDSPAIMEKLTGKKGHNRYLWQGKRQDYSGRSVISIDPELSVDECGVPEDMIPKLFQWHHLNRLTKMDVGEDKIRSVFRKGRGHVKKKVSEIQRLGILDEIPVMLNRAPSLHCLSIQGYTPVPTKSRSLTINPYMCEAYNADLDGDQMAVHVPISEGAVREVKTLMHPLNNPYNPISGKVIIKPRHEMLLGLNIATKEYASKQSNSYNIPTLEEVFQNVIKHKIKVWDKVSSEGMQDTAGVLAVKYCLPKSMRGKIPVINSKTIDTIVEKIILIGKSELKRSLDLMSKLGFALATLYSPTINLVNVEGASILKEPLDRFNKRIDVFVELYNDGFMDDSEYDQVFNEQAAIARKEVEELINGGVISEEDCFMQLVKSGARGNISNISQIYANKGVIARNGNQSFTVMIANSFVDGLYPLEHFMSAFGTRSDVMSRSKKTSDTGYASRLMCHTNEYIVVRSEDCGTNEGVTISKADIAGNLRIMDEVLRKQKVETTFAEIIEGRYELGSGRYIDLDTARKLASDPKVYEIKIRSVLTCRDACCAKCYGADTGHRSKNVPVGHPVGIIAAQGIGGLMTQLAMDQFQGGGTTATKGVASDFDRVKALINMSDISKMPNKFPLYDPLAWTYGRIVSQQISSTKQRVQIEPIRKEDLEEFLSEYNGTEEEKLQLAEYVMTNRTVSRRDKTIPADIELKKFAYVGEPISLNRGDLYIREVLDFKGIAEAQKQLTYQLYLTYREKEEINFKQFECLTLGMTLYMIIKSSSPKLKAGKFYTQKELKDAGIYETDEEIIMVAKIKGVSDTKVMHSGLISNIELENVVKGISRAVIMGNTDNCNTPMSSMMMGLNPVVGVNINPNYIQERLAQFNV